MALTPAFFPNSSTSSGTQATWLGASILRSSLWFARTSVNDSLASENPIRSNLPLSTRGSDSSAWKSAKRRLDEPLLMVRTECIGSIRFLAIQDRIVPASRRSNSLDLGWPPGVCFVFMDGRAGLQDRIDNPPRFLHIIFAGEQRGLSRHGGSQ